MIVRNEEENLRACLTSIHPHVEEVIVVDTGSTDGTLQIAREFAHKVVIYDCENTNEGGARRGQLMNFSNARNLSFFLASKPWVMWLDGDDIVRGGENLAGIVHGLQTTGAGDNYACSVSLPYEYDKIGDKVVSLQTRERIFSPKRCFEWREPVHEVCCYRPEGGLPLLQRQYSEVVIEHRRRHLKSKNVPPERNLNILEAHYNSGARDARTLHYYGMELSHARRFGHANDILQQHMQVSTWDDERMMSLLRIIDNFEAEENWAAMLAWSLRAQCLMESWPESYECLMRAYYWIGMAYNNPRDWQRCIHFGKLALSMPLPRSPLATNPMIYKKIHEFLNVACARAGDVKGALESAREIGHRNAGVLSDSTNMDLPNYQAAAQ